MSIEVIETDTSREQTDARTAEGQVSYLRFTLIADDGESDADLRTWVRNYLPAFFRDRRFQTFHITPQGTELYNVEAQYGRQKPGAIRLNFDSGDQKEKLTQALPLTDEEGTELDEPDQQYFPAPNPDFDPEQEEDEDNRPTLPQINFQGAIGVKRDSGKTKAEGKEIGVGGLDFTVEVDFGPGATLDGDTLNLFHDLRWCVNSDEIHVVISGVYMHFMPGELLYRGVSGGQQSFFTEQESQDWEGKVTLRFSKEDNIADGIVFGIPHVTKEGWDYAEPVYEETATPGILLPKVRQVNVSRVYYRAELAELFFGSRTDGPPPPEEPEEESSGFDPDPDEPEE